MDLFGKAAYFLLLAGSLLTAAGGCSRESNGSFSTYDHLKKAGGHHSLDNAAGSDEKSSPAPNAAATSAVNAPAQTAGPVSTTGSAGLKVVPSTSPPAPSAVPGSQKSIDPAAPKRLEMPKPSTVVSAKPPGASFGASPPKPTLASAALFPARKVHLLVPSRTFKAEGSEKALRVTYDDLDLLKVMNMDPVTPDAPAAMPGWLKSLDGRRIRIRGFMYPTFQQTGVHAFGLARDNQICCFGKNPKIYDVFDVALRRGVTTDYISGRPFDVVGVFHIRPEATDGELYRLYDMDDAVVVTK